MQKIFSLLLLSCVSFFAYAEGPTDGMIEELFRVTKVEQMVEPMYDSVEESMHETIKHFFDGKKLTARQKKALSAAPKRIADVMRKEFSWEVIKPAIAKVYRETYTIEEVIAMIEFNRTEIGQSIINKTSKVMRESMVENKKMLNASMPRIMAEIESIRREVEAMEEGAKAE